MVMTKMPPRPPTKKRELMVKAKPEDFDAKKGKRFKLLSSDEESDGSLPHYQPPPKKKHDPRANVEMGSQNSGPSEHSDHSSQEPDNK
jgi:hypothetical protein